jgi:hypothetical protein
MAGLVPAIHVFYLHDQSWMPGTVRLVLGPAEPDPSAGHDEVVLVSAPITKA